MNQRLDYQTFIELIDSQVLSSYGCKGHDAFKRDIEKLKIANTGSGLSAITANTWLEEICKMTQPELLEYVNHYVEGTLDAWWFFKK